MQTTPVNAVFEGGGVKGISLTGAVSAAEQHGVIFNRVAGTSSGSLVAALLAAGYTAAEMKEVIEKTPFRKLLKRNMVFDTKIIGPALRLLLRKGLYSGDALEQWMYDLLKVKGIRTFGDLPKDKLRIIASDITNSRLLVLPQDIAPYGIVPDELSVARAVRMSSSIPYFFEPVRLRQPSKERKKLIVKTKFAYVVDGGLLSNYPLWLFEDDLLAGAPIPVIGFQMVGRSDLQPHPINGPFTMLQAMFDAMLSARDERYIEKHKLIRTVKIPTLGVSSTEFSLSPQQSEELYQSGLTAGHKFFESWDRTLGTLRISIKKMK